MNELKHFSYKWKWWDHLDKPKQKSKNIRSHTLRNIWMHQKWTMANMAMNNFSGPFEVIMRARIRWMFAIKMNEAWSLMMMMIIIVMIQLTFISCCYIGLCSINEQTFISTHTHIYICIHLLYSYETHTGKKPGTQSHFYSNVQWEMASHFEW